MYLIVTIVALLTWAWIAHSSKKYVRHVTSNIPGPINIPLWGCLHEAITINHKNAIAKEREIFAKYGNIVKGWALNLLFVNSCDVELSEQILSSSRHITKPSITSMLHPWLGVGLLLSDGQKWHSRRKLMTRAFHFNLLEDFLEVFDRQSSVLIECLAKKSDGETAFDIHPLVSSATLDVIAETAMGTKVNAQADQSMAYNLAVKEISELVNWRFSRVYLHNEAIFMLMHPFKKWRQTKLIRILHKFTLNVIEERRSTLEKTLPNPPADDGEIGIKKQMPLLDILLQASVDGKPLSNEDIREEVDTFMFAGYDTTAAAVSFTLHLLARHPQVQNKLLAEIQQVYGNIDSPKFTLMNLNNLKYMECVIKESLRMYPPVPGIGRELTEDFKYKHSRLGNGILTAGTKFAITLRAQMNDENVFKNAASFMPERHESNDAYSPFAFIPFSAGPRNCIGQKYAMYELKVMLTRIILAYELLPLGQDVEPMYCIVMRSNNGIQLGMRKRNIENGYIKINNNDTNNNIPLKK